MRVSTADGQAADCTLTRRLGPHVIWPVADASRLGALCVCVCQVLDDQPVLAG